MAVLLFFLFAGPYIIRGNHSIGGIMVYRRRQSRTCSFFLFGIALLVVSNAFAQVQNHYAAATVTGQLVLTRTVSPIQAQSFLSSQALVAGSHGPETTNFATRLSHPHSLSAAASIQQAAPLAQTTSKSLVVNSGAPGFGFNGISHFDQRQASSGNQFSVEPPNPSIASANGFVLEGVNNAVRIFTTSGTPAIQTISSNQLFGVAPAINRTTLVRGVFPTDMRVYFDEGISRWFVLQRAQDNDSAGNPLNSSHIYLAVSQAADPTMAWNVYVMDTTNAANPACPCLLDFPQIGSDQFGFYISANEYNTSLLQFADTTILAISKAQLGAGASTPNMSKFTLPTTTGFEFSIQPATTPPGASNFIASGGVEFFVSSQAFFSTASSVGIWAMSNTASLQGASPAPFLTQTTVSTLNYVYPNAATQPAGPQPYGNSLHPPGQLEFLDGGPDSRILSLAYAGAQLYTTFAAQVQDDNGVTLVGGCYLVLSPTLRSGVLAAKVVKQGYLSVRGNHLLRPAITVNAQGTGVIGATLVGPNYYPSAAFAPFDLTPTTPSTLNIASLGVLPEDGFSGYFPQPTTPVARWGDYSTAITSTDGTMWMVNEYIPNTPPTSINSVGITTPSPLSNGAVGVGYSVQVSAGGGITPYTFSATGLPAGLSMSASGVISGSPTTAGTKTAQVTVTDSTSPTHLTASANLSITINPALAITNASPLANGVIGSAYSAQLGAAGGVAPYMFNAAGLPAGLSMSTGGFISGTTTAAGSSTVLVTVTDSTSPTPLSATASLSLTVVQLANWGTYISQYLP
jgi:hypothetical protein